MAVEERRVSELMMTCAACTRVLPADGEGFLPAHVIQCAGSHTKGYPARPLPEAKPLYIEFVDEEAGNGEDRHLRVIAAAARYFSHWVNDYGMPRDYDSLIRLSAHANNAQHASLGLLNPRTAQVASAGRRRVDRPIGKAL